MALDLAALIGVTLAERYRIEGRLGQGGMGCVFLARDLRLNNQRAAVKFPLLDRFEDAELRARWNEEISRLINLEPHAHIIRVRDQGVLDGVPYFVMDFAAGGSLADKLEAAGGSMTPKEVANWLEPVAKALDHLHRLNVIHRDVKPGNIVFDGADNAYVTDFGIAKLLGSPGITGTGFAAGSLAYMAPEAIKSRYAAPYDQYALATTVYECLSGGHLPFEMGNPQALLSIKAIEKPKRLSEYAPKLKPKVVDCVMRALEADPEKRFASCSEFAETFRSEIPPPVPRWVLVAAATAFVIGVGIGLSALYAQLLGPTNVMIVSSPPAMISIEGRADKTPYGVPQAVRGRSVTYTLSRPGYKTIDRAFVPSRWKWGSLTESVSLEPGCAPEPSAAVLRVKFDEAVSLETQVELQKSGSLRVVGATCAADASVTSDGELVVKDAGGEAVARGVPPTAPDHDARLNGILQSLLIQNALLAANGGADDAEVRVGSKRIQAGEDPEQAKRMRVRESAYIYLRSKRGEHLLLFGVDSEGTVTLFIPERPELPDRFDLNRWILATGTDVTVAKPEGQLTVFLWTASESWNDFLGAMEFPAKFAPVVGATWKLDDVNSSVAFKDELLRRLPTIGTWSRAAQKIQVE
jgi:hypothetical protein